jgi:hypothetical protein
LNGVVPSSPQATQKLTRFVLLSVMAAIATIALKTSAWLLTVRERLPYATVFTHVEPREDPASFEDARLDR